MGFGNPFESALNLFGKAAPAAGLLGGPVGVLAGPVIGALSSLLAPNKAEQEKKAQLELMAKENEYGIAREGRREDRVNKYLQPERKQTDLSKNLPQVNDLLTRLTMGLGKETFGGDRGKDWGIDWNSLFGGLQQTPPGGSYDSPPPGGGGGPGYGGPGGRLPIEQSGPMDVSQYGQAPPMGGQGSMIRMGTGGGGANPNMYADALMRKYGMEA